MQEETRDNLFPTYRFFKGIAFCIFINAYITATSTIPMACGKMLLAHQYQLLVVLLNKPSNQFLNQ